MKKLLSFVGVSLITAALLDPLIYAMLENPIPWWRDILMLVAGVGCFYALIRYRDYL